MVAAAVALIGLPCCVCSCASTCADEKCGGPSNSYLVSGTLVTVSRVDGHVTSKPTAGEVSLYVGALPNQGEASKIRTTSTGRFELHLSTGTYYFTGKADSTGAACTTARPLVVGQSSAALAVTIKCPVK